MKKTINKETIEGRVYQFDLEVKKVQNTESENYGKDFISGTLEVAVDEDGLNVVPVHYTYVTPVTSKGKTNATYTALAKIISEKKDWVTVGKDNAMMVSLSPSLSLNEFYDKEDKFVSVKVNEGGFAEIVNSLDAKATFTTDMLINRVTEVEPDDEKGTPYMVKVGGAVFNFKNELLPVEFTVCEAGQRYFLDLGASASNPIFTKVWGVIKCSSETVVKTEESAFGEAAVKSYEKKSKDWIITGCAKEPYDFGDESVLTVAEVQKAMQDREVKIADIKKRQEEYEAKKGSSAKSEPASAAAVAANIPTGSFKF